MKNEIKQTNCYPIRHKRHNTKISDCGIDEKYISKHKELAGILQVTIKLLKGNNYN